MSVKKIRPFLWYNGNALEAAELYVSLFPNSKITHRMPGPGGVPMGVEFELDGQRIVAFNGGPKYPLTPSVSLYVDCADQGEIDRLWAALTADGGKESQCGWLVDRFGLSWQIIPSILPKLLADTDPERAGRTLQAMLGMQKIDIAALERAQAGT
ncbi:MAG: VOC family protein [Gemmatimonadales bacterium]